MYHYVIFVFQTLCVHWTMKIRSHSYAECINESKLGICSNDPNGILLAIPLAYKSPNKFNF